MKAARRTRALCESDEICVETLELSFSCKPRPEGCEPSCDSCIPQGYGHCQCFDGGLHLLYSI